MNSSQQPHIESEDQIDIIALISKVWAGRKFVIKSAVIASVIGVLVAIRLLIPIQLLPCLPQTLVEVLPEAVVD